MTYILWVGTDHVTYQSNESVQVKKLADPLQG